MGTGHQGGGPDPLLSVDDKDKVLIILRECRGIIAIAAQHLKIHRDTLSKYLKRMREADPEYGNQIDDIGEGLKDLAEGKMLTAILADDGQMIRFFLERRARDRGYGVKAEVTGKDGGPIQTDSMTIDPDRLSFADKRKLLEIYRKAKTDRSESGEEPPTAEDAEPR